VAGADPTAAGHPPRWPGVLGGVVGLGAAGLLWSTAIERQLFVLRRLSVPVLTPGSWPVRVLHLSDLHISPGQERKVRWVSALADLRPDLVINTGDTLSHRGAVPVAVRAFGELLDQPGAFVFGNNDFTAPVPKSPHRYFVKEKPIRKGPALPWRDLRAAQAERGWVDLTNRHAVLDIRGQRIALAGVNDPHSKRDRYDEIAGPAEADAAVRIGVAHSPEPRVLDRFAADSYDLLLAGHTHGGQVRIPGFGAVVTNCDLDRSRARGLSRWGSRMWLHVSAGLGNNPYMPMRFACRPEATLLTLVPREH
jgi:predicted MPP superfamily phosphohydrolase